jgi:hypothetical protein
MRLEIMKLRSEEIEESDGVEISIKSVSSTDLCAGAP